MSGDGGEGGLGGSGGGAGAGSGDTESSPRKMDDAKHGRFNDCKYMKIPAWRYLRFVQLAARWLEAPRRAC